jgi:pyridinium-3,5-bisthiocarboxylic acid mononucleotide nickel chelatase
MRLAYFDCFSGASGDMLLGALLDAGAPEEAVRNSLDSLGLEGWRLELSRVTRGGLDAAKATVHAPAPSPERSYLDVRRMLAQAPLEPGIRDRGFAVFESLAHAEARVHGVHPEQVTFHEVGAVDAVVDIVGVCACIHHLGIERIVTSPLATGSSGLVGSSHGPLPVPVPAVVELLIKAGAPTVGRGHDELLTPTGAALLTTLSDDFGTMPAMTVTDVGHGAGARELDHPNLVRVLVGEPHDHNAGTLDLLETNVDDMTPEVAPYVLERLLDAGALDAWTTPIVMKKGRPALTLSVLASSAHAEKIITVLFEETPTLGVRSTKVTREALSRRSIETDVAGHVVRVKIGARSGRVLTTAPEHDDAVAAAQATGLPLREVYARALREARDKVTEDD